MRRDLRVAHVRAGWVPGAGPLTNGMTSPARRTRTRMPTFTPRARSTSWLASVAEDTVVPPTNTGSSTARGTTLPPGPTSQRTSRRIVSRSSAGSLIATAPRGVLARAPAEA